MGKPSSCLKIGILGASWIAQKAIIEPARALPHVQVTALACRDSKRGKAYAETHQIRDVFQSYEDLIKSTNVDTIYVGLPPSEHAYWSKKALIAGNHVICEKPFSMNLAEAQSMQDTAAQSGQRLIEAFHTSYHPAFTACLKLIEQGAIGQLRAITAHLDIPIKDDGAKNQYRPELGGGSMMDLGCYPLHWANSCTDELVMAIEASATLTPSGVDGSMSAKLTYSSGLTAQISCSMTTQSATNSHLSITGTTGSIELSSPLTPHLGGTLTMVQNGKVYPQPLPSSKSTYDYQLDAIATALLNGSYLPTEGSKVLVQQRLMDGIYNAAGLKHLRNQIGNA